MPTSPCPYPCSYDDSAQRHFRVGILLIDNQIWLNADYHFGLAAECALKAIMIFLDPKLQNPQGEIIQTHRFHINRFFSEFKNFIDRYDQQGATPGQNLPELNPFSDWDICLRYAQEVEPESEKEWQARVESHRVAAWNILGMMQFYMETH